MRGSVIRTIGALILCCAFGLAGLVALDRSFPPDLHRADDTSTVVFDQAGVPLRAFRAMDGRWRLPAASDTISPAYRELLIAIEDRRFWQHPGIDPAALLRALGQAVWQGHVVSGASTITMQLARLLEPRPRTLGSKLVEMARALQLEQRFSKDEILDLYLTLVPMGGNLEGVRAGSLAWFGKEPLHLSTAEAALLVALPQSPERLRPDSNPGAAARARHRVLAKAAALGILDAADEISAEAAPLPEHRFAMPRLAPHLAERLARESGPGAQIGTTVDAILQAAVERQLQDAASQLEQPVNIAAIVADYRTGAIEAWAGSADYLDQRRHGMVDFALAVRSPGSALKPFAYGLAFETLVAHPDSLVRDGPTRFDDYAPQNFDQHFSGDVTVREALQRSLNLPAVLVLDRLGPLQLTQRFSDVGLPLRLDDREAPGLPLVLGGVGTTLLDLVRAYAAIARGGDVPTLTPLTVAPPSASGPPLLSGEAAEAIARILAGIPPPPGSGAAPGGLAYKTGTSHRFRDGWAIGFDGRHVIGVWLGRSDAGSCRHCTGRTAAGILFGLKALLPAAPLPEFAAKGVLAGPAPPALERLERASTKRTQGDEPRITFPVDGSTLVAGSPGREVMLSAEGGARPYRWLVDGRSLESAPWRRQAPWRPAELGFSTIELVDHAGRSQRIGVRITSPLSSPIQ